MFIVYSPEGQSLALTVQQLPVLRVDPATRVNKVEDTGLEQLKPDEGKQQSVLAGQSKALRAYQQSAKEQPQRRVAVQVAEIMSEPLITINQEATLAQAFDRMTRLKIDYLPVVDETTLVGLLSRERLLHKILLDDNGEIELGGEKQVFDVMQKQVITTSRDTDIRQVAQVFSEYRVGALVIMNSVEQPIGMVTRGDLIKRLAKEPPIEIYI
ncbi:HPP family protein [Thiomicrorhabdus sp. 6S3-12]|uniref:CBS domain-containing protein n=1 Tax=Thiomicrorhabdus sp. 6S3-12 TaxID=2819681 RepID=UPI001AACE4E1|nr:CBS domain-containing protein [Thiomicrorhabdus sp. 6S3-12]MBO1924297.1 CBS domain-containing protein [Thiomicrorhabdus sp. 6S3-12]